MQGSPLCPDAPSVRQKVIEHHFDAYVSKLPETEFAAASTVSTSASDTRPSPIEEAETQLSSGTVDAADNSAWMLGGEEADEGTRYHARIPPLQAKKY